MANLRINDDSVARFRQKPRGDMPQGVHAGQPPGPPAPDRHYDETRAAVESNIDQQRAQAAAAHDQGRRPSVTPQAPPFLIHSAKVTPISNTGSRER